VVFESKKESLAILEEIKGAVMGRQLREARAALREARNDLMNAEQSLINLGFEIAIDEFQKLDDDARAAKMRTLGLPVSLLAGVDAERLSSNLLPLVAPFDGVVIGRDADPSSSIFEVADLSTMWIVLNVAKEDAARIQIGQNILFRPDGSDRDFESHVTWISTELDETTRTLQVRAEVSTGEKTSSEELSGLRANAFGRGRIEISRRSIASVVPLESVQSLGGEWVVFVPKDATTFELKTVEKGLESDGSVEVEGDLAGATHVVGPGSHVLKSRVLLERMEAGRL
jgi:cobalt-zinc-cadmium efflux system membrane fusion protein